MVQGLQEALDPAYCKGLLRPVLLQGTLQGPVLL